MLKTTRLLLTLSLLLTACASSSADTQSTLPPPIVTIIPATSTPTQTPPPTATRTTDQAMQPYTIPGLRAHDYQSGKITLLAETLQTDNFTRYLISYPSDGLTITGVLQVPAVGEPPYPVIVMNHGFFSRTVYTSGDGTDRAAEFLNRKGYLTVSSDYRTWGDADHGESLFYSGLAIDVVNLIRALPSLPQADPERVGIWGHSMGGGVTLKVLTILAGQAASQEESAGRVAPQARIETTETTPPIRAAVLYSTVSGDFSDIIARWGPGCIGDILQGELAFGCNSSDVLPLDLPPDLIAAYLDAVADPVMLRAVSPLYHLDSVTTPLQIHYGTEDGKTYAGTPPAWSQKIYDTFLEQGLPVEIFAYEGEGHSFIGDPWFRFMAQTQLFFDKYVK